jgi:hypothetical protein
MAKFNLLKVYRAKFVEVPKMITLAGQTIESLSALLKQPITMNSILSMGRVKRLAERGKFSKQFLTFVLKMYEHHGAEAVVKWLKANLVAIQKELGQDRMSSTVPLGTALPYSRLTGGLPRIIPAHCRAKIRQGDTAEIRFWTGLFNLYRILECPGKLKLSTITDAFTGSAIALSGYMDFLSRPKSLFFDCIPQLESIRKKELEPQDVVLSRASSPSNKQSYHGILQDIYLLKNHYPKLYNHIWAYLAKVNEESSSQFGFRLMNLEQFVQKFKNWSGKPIIGKDGSVYTLPSPFSAKDSFKKGMFAPEYELDKGFGLSQFAIKVEAAGKYRLFALLDSISQMVLAPLHDMLFDLLKALPNDGTFDQEESIKRSQQKAIKAGCAYSFDLTAATDRLPAGLTAIVIARITGTDIAKEWLGIMTDRDFWFNAHSAKEHEITPGPYRYAVGQPMGGLSSWAGLAVTHHWIVQLSAYLVTNSYSWNEDYEILGDDLVIFDKQIADQYLIIMKHLGCEINMHKSIVSHHRPVFEFAKRTCFGDKIVSGISFNQIRAGWNIGSIVANCYQWCKSGLIPNLPVLTVALSKYSTLRGVSIVDYVFNKKTNNQVMSNLAMSILSLFGVYHQNGRFSLKDLMTAIIDPNYSGVDFSAQAVGLPLNAALRAIFSTLVDDIRPYQALKWSNYSKREDMFEENKSGLALVLGSVAYNTITVLCNELPSHIEKYAKALRGEFLNDQGLIVTDFSNFPDELQEDLKALNGIAESLLGLYLTDSHPEYAKHLLENYFRNNCVEMDGVAGFEWTPDDKYYNELTEISNWIEAMKFKYDPTGVDDIHVKNIIESSPILGNIRVLAAHAKNSMKFRPRRVLQ